MSILHRVEDFNEPSVLAPEVHLTFETKYRGLWQCKYDGGGGVIEFASEPPYESLTSEEQRKIKEISAIVYEMVFPQKYRNL